MRTKNKLITVHARGTSSTPRKLVCNLDKLFDELQSESEFKEKMSKYSHDDSMLGRDPRILHLSGGFQSDAENLVKTDTKILEVGHPISEEVRILPDGQNKQTLSQANNISDGSSLYNLSERIFIKQL